MAIAYVQDTGKISGSGVGFSEGSFGSLPTVGNHVFALPALWSAGSISPIVFTDNQPNTWATDKESSLSDSNLCAIGSAKVATSSGTFTVRVTPAVSAFFEWVGIEFSGLAAASWLDQVGTQVAGAGSTTITATAAGANSQANILVLAVASHTSIVPDTNINITTPSGHTSRAVEQNNSATVGMRASSLSISAVETSAATWGFDAGSAHACIATYKDANPGGASTSKNRTMMGVGERRH